MPNLNEIICNGIVCVPTPLPVDVTPICFDEGCFALSSSDPVIVQTEIDGFETCYGGVNAHIKIVNNEDGTLNKFVAYLLDGSGTVIDPALLNQMTSCPNTTNQIMSNAVAIAGDDINGNNASEAGFIGLANNVGSSSFPGILQSISVSVYDADPSLVLNALPNEISVRYPGGNEIPLQSGDSEVFSIIRDKDLDLGQSFIFTARGRAYAKIIYTYI